MANDPKKWSRFGILASMPILSTIGLDINLICHDFNNLHEFLVTHRSISDFSEIFVILFPGISWFHMGFWGIDSNRSLALANLLTLALLIILFAVSGRIGGGRLSLSLISAGVVIALTIAEWGYLLL